MYNCCLIIVVFLILYLFKQNLSNELFSQKPRPPIRPFPPIRPIFPVKPTKPIWPRAFSWPKFQKFMKDRKYYNSRIRQYSRHKWRWYIKYNKYQNKYQNFIFLYYIIYIFIIFLYNINQFLTKSLINTFFILSKYIKPHLPTLPLYFILLLF